MAESGGNGAKAFGGIMAVVAILATTIGSIAYFVRPLNDRLHALEQRHVEVAPKLDKVILNSAQLAEVVKDHDHHVASGGHPSLSERVKAIEANGVGNQHRDRLIRVLWFKVYGEELPAVNGAH